MKIKDLSSLKNVDVKKGVGSLKGFVLSVKNLIPANSLSPKNVVPLVVAILLGLAAVFAVWKTTKQQDHVEEPTRDVVIALSDIPPSAPISASRVGIRSVPESAVPRHAIDAENIALVYNQKAHRLISKGDYVQDSDLELDQSKSRVLGDGQWGVPVQFADATLLKVLRPGDDIAIIGSFDYTEIAKSGKNADAASDEIDHHVTAVIYPRVSILAIDGSTVLLSMPPQQAIALTAIQRQAELYPLLRKKNDDSALNRLNGGKFEDDTLPELVKGLQPIDIPLLPSEVKEKK